jgi:ribosomal protein S18 acetylase RimI-like enzyme
MLIRRATDTDVGPLHRLVESAYRGDSAKRGWTHEADLLGGQRTDGASLTAIITDSKSAILIAEEGDALIGCVQIASAGEGLGYLGLLAVSPAVQAAGIGKKLMTAAERELAASFAATRVEMTVIAARTELIAYYTRRGYHCTGEERAFPYGDDRFGDPRRDDLHFVVLEKRLSGG